MAEVPVIIGVGDIVNRTSALIEPLDLISSAIREALSDTGLSGTSLADLTGAVDDLTIVKSWTWPYDDLPRLVAERTGTALRVEHRRESPHGGNQPVKCLDEACRRIALGESRVAIVAGGEALASLTQATKTSNPSSLPWTKPTNALSKIFSPTTLPPPPNYAGRHSLHTPVQIYPLYENALRHSLSQSLPANHRSSATLYAAFSRTASANPNAWTSRQAPKPASEIASPTPKNRMIAHPYPLLMTALNAVNLSAAVVLADPATARALGVPPDRHVHVRAAAGTAEHPDFWRRPSFDDAPAVRASVRGAVVAAGLRGPDEVGRWDLYSCFPVVPKLAGRAVGWEGGAEELGAKGSVLGGLTFFGGAGNGYSLHALTEMTRLLRKDRRGGRRANGLVLANGGVLSYQHAVVLSTEPAGEQGRRYPTEPVLPDMLHGPAPEIVEKPDGRAVIETYTVDYDRENRPKLGHVIGRLVGTGERFIANHADQETLMRLASWTHEPIGLPGKVSHDVESGRNLFTLDDGVVRNAKL